MTKLSVNVNKLATLRNSRGKNLPNVMEFSRKILSWGAAGITIHPRPDGRHIRPADVDALNQVIAEHARTFSSTPPEFNIEGYPSLEFLSMIERIRPSQCTLVPDPPEALTSNAGWPFGERESELTSSVQRLRDAGVRSSLFLEPLAMMPWDWEALARILPDRIELYTEAYADSFGTPNCDEILEVYKGAAEKARNLGIEINAGHDLNQQNLERFLTYISFVEEVSIGHALICESLQAGMESTVQAYLKICSKDLSVGHPKTIY